MTSITANTPAPAQKTMAEKSAEVLPWLKIHHPKNTEPAVANPRSRSKKQALSPLKITFQEFLENNIAWFELLKQYPLLAIPMEDTYPLLLHVDLVDPDGLGISKGVKAKIAIKTILSSWSVLSDPTPDAQILKSLFPQDISIRRSDRRADWQHLAGPALNPGLVNWLQAGSPATPGQTNIFEFRDVLRSVLEMSDRLTPDLVRRIQTKAEMDLFQAASAILGAEAGLAVARNSDFTLKRLCQQAVRAQSTDPNTRRDLAEALEANTKRLGIQWSVFDTRRADNRALDRHRNLPPHLRPDPIQPASSSKKSPRLTGAKIHEELRQIQDAYRADPESFLLAESFSRWIELTDEFHRRLRNQDRNVEVQRAWDSYIAFPSYPLEGYRSKNLLMIPLRDSVALTLEGALRQHCVGSYAHTCASGNTAIYSVRTGTGEIIGTIEIDQKSGRIHQFRGQMNRSISNTVTQEVRNIIQAMYQELDLKNTVIKAFAQTVHNCKKTTNTTQEPKALLLAAIETMLKANQSASLIGDYLAKNAEPDELPVLQKYLAARAADYVKTESQANDLDAWQQKNIKDKTIHGVHVDPMRLLIQKLEARLAAGDLLKPILEDLKSHLPEEWEEYALHLLIQAEALAKTDQQKASIEKVLAMLPKLAKAHLDAQAEQAALAANKKTKKSKAPSSRWLGLTTPRATPTSQEISPALVLAYIDETLPKVRELRLKEAISGVRR